MYLEHLNKIFTPLLILLNKYLLRTNLWARHGGRYGDNVQGKTTHDPRFEALRSRCRRVSRQI